MKVELIAPPFVEVPPRGYGGTERILDLLGRGLVGKGVDVHLGELVRAREVWGEISSGLKLNELNFN